MIDRKRHCSTTILQATHGTRAMLCGLAQGEHRKYAFGRCLDVAYEMTYPVYNKQREDAGTRWLQNLARSLSTWPLQC